MSPTDVERIALAIQAMAQRIADAENSLRALALSSVYPQRAAVLIRRRLQWQRLALARLTVALVRAARAEVKQ